MLACATAKMLKVNWLGTASSAVGGGALPALGVFPRRARLQPRRGRGTDKGFCIVYPRVVAGSVQSVDHLVRTHQE